MSADGEFDGARTGPSDARPPLSSETALPVLLFGEITAQLSYSVIVKGLLGSAAMSVLFGDTNTGKTFLALHIGIHVAAGWDWFGRKVRKGAVVYVAGEGSIGIQNRIAAFKSRHEVSDLPLAVVPMSIDLRSDQADTERLVDAANAVAEEFGLPVALIVVDTLSRALAGGNENAPEDMGALVMEIDRVRQATGAHVLLVHHSGKDQARGARGHSLLRAAVDTEIEITHDDASKISSARVTKQRDLPADGVTISFRLEHVDLGTDNDGDMVSSMVVVPAEAAPPSERKALSLPPSAKVALDLLHKAIAEAGEPAPPSSHIPDGVRVVQIETWRRYAYAGQISESDDQAAKRQAFRRSADVLQARHAIAKWDIWVWLCQ